jgi:hypothetical protein
MAGTVNWWMHMLVIPGLHGVDSASSISLVLSPLTVFLKSPELGNLPWFRKGTGRPRDGEDLGAKMRLDAFTCVECRLPG